MAVTAQTPLIKYTASGSATVFTYPFRILDDADLEVYVGGVQQTTGFVVDGIGDNAGGTVTFEEPPVAGVEIKLQRNTPRTRETDYVEGGALRAQTLDDDIDRIVMMLQDIEAQQNEVDPSYAADFEVQTFTATAGQTVFTLTGGYDFTPGGDDLEVSVNGAVQIAGTDYVETNSTTITFTSGLNAGDVVVMRVTDLRAVTGNANFVSPMDFGGIGDGVADDTSAVQQAINAASAVGAVGVVFLPIGKNFSVGPLTLTRGITIRGGSFLLQGNAVSGSSTTYDSKESALTLRSGTRMFQPATPTTELAGMHFEGIVAYGRGRDAGFDDGFFTGQGGDLVPAHGEVGATTCENFYISAFRCKFSNFGRNAFELSDVSNCRFDTCYFTNCGPTSSRGTREQRRGALFFYNRTFYRPNVGSTAGANAVTGTTVVNCYFGGCARGVGVDGQAQYCDFGKDNLYEFCDVGIECRSSIGLVITGAKFEGNFTNGVETTDVISFGHFSHPSSGSNTIAYTDGYIYGNDSRILIDNKSNDAYIDLDMSLKDSIDRGIYMRSELPKIVLENYGYTTGSPDGMIRITQSGAGGFFISQNTATTRDFSSRIDFFSRASDGTISFNTGSALEVNFNHAVLTSVGDPNPSFRGNAVNMGWFKDRIHGSGTSAQRPTTSLGGGALLTGATFYDTTIHKPVWWDGSAWVDITSGLGGGGSVTSVSVVSANGFAGTVATSTTTPAITLSTTVNGLLKGNGTSISAAVAGTDYLTTAVTSAVAGSGIGVSGATGAVTFSNTGVLSVAGTTNQISTSASTGAIALSLPDRISVGSVTNLANAAAGSFAGDYFVSDKANAAFGFNTYFDTVATQWKATRTNTHGWLFRSDNAGKLVLFSQGNSTTAGGNNTNSTVVQFGQSGTASTTTSTGALIVTGGLGVSGQVTATTFSGSGASLTSIPNAALVNSSVTVNTSGLLTGGGAVALGAALSLSATPQVYAQTTAPTVPAGIPYIWFDTTGGNIQMWVNDGL